MQASVQETIAFVSPLKQDEQPNVPTEASKKKNLLMIKNMQMAKL